MIKSAANVIFLPIYSDNPRSHFQIEDIQRIADANIGMRHVSSRETAQLEKKTGFNLGCAFNLTFAENEHRLPGFENLPEELLQDTLSPEEKRTRLQQYEKGINRHFEESIVFDVGPLTPGKTVGEICQKVQNTCFLIIDYAGFSPTDITAYGGLGRFAKQNISPELIKAILPFFEVSNISADSSEVIQTEEQYERLLSKIIGWWRLQFLETLRNPALQFTDTYRTFKRAHGL